MSMPMIITLVVLTLAVILLVGNILRTDLVALLVILALVLTNVVSVDEGLAGFSSPVVIIIACMFIVGKAITHTGIAREVGGLIIRRGGTDETRLMLLLMAAAALVGSFMSSTATAAIFIPIALTVADKAGLNHKRLLMPLAMASLISGMMTLVATTPNIVLNSALLDAGLEGLGFFTFTPFGVCILIMAMAFMAIGGRRLLAARDSKPVRKQAPTIDELLHYHNIAQNEYFFRVPANSDLVGNSVAAMRLNPQHAITLLAVRTTQHGRHVILSARPDLALSAEDQILVIAAEDKAKAFVEHFSLQTLTLSPQLKKAFFQVVGIAEVLINPDSSLIGKTLRDSGFQHMFHSMVLGIRRSGETLTQDIASLPLSFGDVLLLCAAWTDILQLKQYRDKYLLLTLPQDYSDYVPARDKQGLAMAVLVAMVAAMALGVLPPVTAILAAAIILVLARCVPLASIYEVIDWPTIVLIAGMMPLALALQKTGLIGLVADWFMHVANHLGVLGVLVGLFCITAVIGCLLSNTAVAILLAPVAIHVGQASGIGAQACVMTVAIACSAAFLTPFGSPVLLLVREPGEYSFLDYVKTGLPLLLGALPITLLLVWIIYL